MTVNRQKYDGQTPKGEYYNVQKGGDEAGWN
jgi:hypothetical protein